jgi:hypothetical protein
LRGSWVLTSVVVCLLFATSARADERSESASRPSEERRWSLAALGNWGGASTQAVAGDTSASRKYGLGLRAGYTFPVRFHLGAVVSFTRGALVGTDLAQRIESGGEIGWDIPIGIALVRPLLGGGAVVGDGRTSPAFWPGVALVGAVPSTPIFVGLDGRLFVQATRPRVAATPTSFVVAGARL